MSGRGKRIVLVVAAIVGLAFLACVAAEVVLRARGVRPWTRPTSDIQVEPGGSLFRADPVLGYTHLPGRFRVTVPTGYAFTVTNGADTLRVTSPADASGDERARGEDAIWIFGCSFTFGWGLDDADTYPWRVQERFPDREVVNFGVNGYGTIHSLSQLDEALKSRRTARVAVLAYADFHDKRNTFLRIRQKTVAAWASLGPLVQPYARFDDAGELRFGMADATYHEFPLMRWSALAHYIELQWNHFEERRERSHAVSEALVVRMAERAKEHGVLFVVAGITGGDDTRRMLAFARERGLLTVDVHVDLKLSENSNAPHVDHPSARANRRYADTLAEFLEAGVLDAAEGR